MKLTPITHNGHVLLVDEKAGKAKEFTEEQMLKIAEKGYLEHKYGGDTSPDKFFSEMRDYINSLRPKRTIVSASPVIEEVCASDACMCRNYMEKKYCPFNERTANFLHQRDRWQACNVFEA